MLRTAIRRSRRPRASASRELRRLGKRIVFALEDELFLVLHLMIAGRLRWLAPGAKPPGKIALALLRLRRRHARIHRGRHASGARRCTWCGARRRCAALDPGGLERAGRRPRRVRARGSRRENHTLKRALTDPRLFSGIGNAYSDEILHRARLSPLALTATLADEEIARLYAATRATLARVDRAAARARPATAFPEKVTAFRAGMAVHGRYGKPCPVCGAPVQRIVYAENETNYCARCQTGGKLLADRALSRLLHKSWPRTIEELE